MTKTMGEAPLDLDALDALEAAATPGPWYQHEDYYEGSGVFSLDDAAGLSIGEVRSFAPKGDAAFIVAARNAYPSLAAEIRVLRAALKAIANN